MIEARLEMVEKTARNNKMRIQCINNFFKKGDNGNK